MSYVGDSSLPVSAFSLLCIPGSVVRVNMALWLRLRGPLDSCPHLAQTLGVALAGQDQGNWFLLRMSALVSTGIGDFLGDSL